MTDKARGFTLLELLVTIIILGIVASFAVPSFRQMILNNQLVSQTNEVSGLVAFARSEASKMQDGVVTVCSSADGASCSGANTWEQGWIVFSDIDADRVVDSGTDELHRVASALGGGNSLRVSGLSSSDGSFIQFSPNGFPLPESLGASPAGTLTVCDSRGASEARAVVVGVAGQVRIARDNDNDGIVEGHDGNGVTCP